MAEKTCATCKWMIDPGVYAKCAHPENVSPVSRLTGFTEAKATYCTTMRQSTLCGEEGRWWEAAQ